MSSVARYDVFLSHNSADKAAVEALAQKLQAAGFAPFLDKWHLIPGDPWQEALEQALDVSTTVAVFIGPSGVSPWHNEEMRAAIDQAVRTRDEYRVIPVLLPGASEAAVASFLARRTWVDFRHALEDEDAFARLTAGIKGEAIAGGTFTLPDKPSPYRGLLPFEAEDARFFFGRETDKNRVLEKLEHSPFVAVVGASGSGKSSLIKAGVLPALQAGSLPDSQQWQVLRCTPGSDPLRALANQVATLMPEGIDRIKIADEVTQRLTERVDGLRTWLTASLANRPNVVLLFVDQFEELFTHCQEGPERCRQRAEQFIANLADAVHKGDGLIRVLITLRADFLDRCLVFTTLRDLLEERQILLGPLDEVALREVIVRPAQAVGAFFEKGLVGMILRDVATETGALPLLEQALYELWLARRGPWLTVEAYEASGGVTGALNRRAQITYEALSKPQQSIARNVLLRLTTLGEGVADTRRRVERGELYGVGVAPSQVDAVLQALSGPEARLVVVDKESVEVAHEALIQQWTTLRRWLEEDREGLRLHRHLTESADEWEGLGRDVGALYRGVRLAQVAEWAATHVSALNPLEQAFLQASVALRDQEIAEQAAQQQRELEAAQKLAAEADARRVAEKIARQEAEQRAEEETRNSRHLRRMIAIVVGLLTVALAAGGSAWLSGQRVRQEQLITQHHLYVSDLNLMQAWQQENSEPQRIEELLARQQAEPGQAELRGFEWYYLWRQYYAHHRLVSGPISMQAVAFAPDGKTIAAVDVAGNVRLWEAGTHTLRFTVKEDPNTLFARGPAERFIFLKYALAGKALLTAAKDGESVKLWDLTTGQEQRTLRHEDRFDSLHLSPDGRTLVIPSSLYYSLWDLSTGEEKKLEAEYGKGAESSWAFAPDSQTLAIGYEWGGVVLWDVTTGQRQAELAGQSTVGVAFSPDGKTIASVTVTGTVTLWDLGARQARLTLEGFKDSQSARASVQFSPDGQSVVVLVVDSDVVYPRQENRVRSWDPASGKEQFTLDEQETAFAMSLLFAPDSQTFVTSSKDNWLRLWDAATGKLHKRLGVHGDRVTDLAFSPDSRTLVSSSLDGTIRLWDTTSAPDYLDLAQLLKSSDDTCLAFSPDGATLATGGRDGQITFWNLTTFAKQGAFQAHTKAVVGLVFDPAGHRLASVSTDQLVKVWDVATAAPLATFAGLPFTGYPGEVGAFFFHGDNLVLALKQRDWGPSPAMKSWNLTTGSAVSLIGWGQNATLSDLAPDGTLAATIGGYADGSGDCAIILWELATQQERTFFRQEPCLYIDIRQATFSPDGKTLAAGVLVYNDSKEWMQWINIHLWELSAGTERLVMKAPLVRGNNPALLRTLTFSPDGALLATISEPSIVRLWDLSTGQPRGALEISATVRSALFSPDSKTLATLSGDAPPQAGRSEVGLWDVATLVQKAELQLSERVDTIVFAPDGRILATLPADYSIAQVSLWDTASGRPLTTLSEPTNVIINVALTKDGRILAATGETDLVHDAYAVKVRDMTTGETVATLQGVKWLEFSPDGSRGVGEDAAGKVALWDLATGKVVVTLAGQGITQPACGSSSAFSADGRLLATLGEGTIMVWDVAVAPAKALGAFAGGGPVALAPDGKTLATGNADGAIDLWNIKSGKQRITLTEFKSFVDCVLFSPDGKTLIITAGGSDLRPAEARLWDVADGQQLTTLQGYEGNGVVAFSPDSKTLATEACKPLDTGAEACSVSLWDPLTGRRLLTLDSQRGKGLAFSPDGKILTMTRAGEVRLWWAATADAALTPSQSPTAVP